MALRELHLFSGVGGGILGGMLLGHTPVCAVELEEYPRRVLLQRQRDGVLPWFPIWDDVRTFDGKPWVGKADVVAGGFPCQDLSIAGPGWGLGGERSGLWKEFARVVREVQPRYVFVENSPMLVGRGLDRVLGDLAEMGFDAAWGVLGADDAGAPHHRKRIWILAHTNRIGLQGIGEQREGPCPAAEVKAWGPVAGGTYEARIPSQWWENPPELPRVDDGVPDGVDILKAIGNAHLPCVAALAWTVLHHQLERRLKETA